MTFDPLKFRPLHDRVWIRRLPDELLDGPILIRRLRDDPRAIDAVNDGTEAHSDYRRMAAIGEIVAVGPGSYDKHHRLQPTVVKPGQTVVFTDWNDFEGAPEGYQLVREADIWGFPELVSLRDQVAVAAD
jgi:co-chaperonin GroES (HSP10)